MSEEQRYNEADIQRYLQHQMTAREMHDFEKALMNDPFLSDALDGYSISNRDVAHNHLRMLEGSLAGNGSKAKVVPFAGRKNGFWRVAAVLFIIVSAAVATFFVLEKPGETTHHKQLAVKRTVAGAKREPTVQKNIAFARPESKGVYPQQNSDRDKNRYTFTKPARDADAISNRTAPSPQVADQDRPAVAALKAPGYATTPAPIEDRDMMPQKDALRTMAKSYQGTTGRIDTGNIFAGTRPDSTIAGVEGNGSPIATAGARAKKSLALGERKADTGAGGLTLAEEVVSSFGRQQNTFSVIADSSVAAEPIKGWDHLQQYIRQHFDSLQISNESSRERIELEFNVDSRGKPIDIQSTSPRKPAIVSRLIEILANGPLWRVRNKAARVRITIEF